MKLLCLFCVTFLFVCKGFSQQPEDPVVWDSTGKFYDKTETASRFSDEKAAYHNFIIHLLKTLSSYASRLPSIKKATYNITLVFTIDTAGVVKAFSADCSPGQKDLENKAMQLIEESPRWFPATKNGKPVKVFRKERLAIIMN
jgi:Gram-negative bacterial TonB protein C-terminal